jgi:hypothetical protein
VHDDVIIMTDIEALLSVDAGRVPAGTVAFFMREPEVELRRRRAIVAGLLGVAAIASGFAGVGRFGVAILLLAAGVFGVLATPTMSDERRSDVKRRVVVVTPTGIVMRDGHGLRSWMFADLQEVSSWRHVDRVDLLLVRRDGSRVFISASAPRRPDGPRRLTA